jgi:hypothetical protein
MPLARTFPVVLTIVCGLCGVADCREPDRVEHELLHQRDAAKKIAAANKATTVTKTATVNSSLAPDAASPPAAAAVPAAATTSVSPATSTASVGMFKLGAPQLIKQKSAADLWTVVVPVEAEKSEHFEKPGLKTAYVVLNEPITTPPTDLKSDGQGAMLNTDKNGERDLVWRMLSARQGLTLEAHFYMNGPQHKAAGTKGVVKYILRGIPDKQLGLFLFEGDDQNSNMIVFGKQDFSEGDGEAVFQAMVAKLPKD